MARRDYVLSRGRMLLTVFCLMLCNLGFSGRASGATFTVTNTSDSGTGSLRQAITDANNSPGSMINITATGTVALLTPLPGITVDVNIAGPGAASLTVSGNNSATVGTIFTIDSGAVSISGLTIANGIGSCGGSSNDRGGGICIFGGTVTLSNSAVINNKGNVGGGIYSQGTLTVSNCTFSGNSSTVADGGGIENDTGTLTVTNSTFSNNTAINLGGGIASTGSMTLTNVTLSDNSAATSGGGVYIFSGTVTVTNTIAAGNTASSNADIAGTFTDGGGNLVGTTGINLAALGNYGGPTQTMLPLPNSPAICAGTANALTTDQRGFPVAGSAGGSTYCTSGKIDSGAVQTNYTAIQFTNAGTGYAATVNSAVSFPAAPIVSVTENGQKIGGVPVTLTFTGAPGSATGLGPVTTVAGVGATFSAITVDETGTGSLNAQLTPGSATLNATASLHILAISLTPAAGALPGATKGEPYSMAFIASGGSTSTYTYSFAVTSGTLPAGLSFNSGTATLGGTPTATGTVGFNVTATDSNNFSGTQSYTLTVNPPVTATQAIPAVTLTVNHAVTAFTPVTGAGGTSPLTYTISPSLPAGLTISSTTGAITGTPTAASAAMSYTVTVTDRNSSTATASFALTVNSALTATVSIGSKTLTANQSATPFTPVTGSGGTAPLTYSIAPTLPAGLMLNASTGVISGTPTASSPQTPYTITITDSNQATATANFSLTVNGAVTATTVIATKTLTQNQPASFIPVTGSGGTAPLSFSISPSLPAGLSISSSTGAITGSPTVTSPATTYTVTVTDTNSATATATFSLAVNSGVTATTAVATTILTASHAATPFTPVTGSGGTAPLSYKVAPNLPAGLTMSASTGAISGTPTAASPAMSYTVTVTDSNQATATASFSLTVNSAVTATLVVPTTTLTVSQAPAPFTPVTGSGGTAPLTYSVSPTLPAGLTLNASTGAISGTPTVASPQTSYTVTVTDTNQATASASFLLTVNAAVTATSTNTETLTVNQVASFTPVTGSGGTAPLRYSITPSLPVALTLNPSTGLVTGAPAAVSAATNYTVTVTDANQVTAQATFTLTVTQATTSVSVASSSAGNTSTVNASVTFTAQITPDSGTTPIPPPYPGSAAPVTGSVSFTDNGSPICSTPVALVSGSYVATCTTSSLQAVTSPHTIMAAYNGSTNYLGSNNSVKQTVNPATSNTTLASSLNPSVVKNPNNHNDSVTFTAKVTPITGPVMLSGSITFTYNGNLIPECATPVPVIPTTGIATCTTTSLGFGSNTILAVYGNDGNFLSSNGTVSQSVQDYGLTASPTSAVSVTQGYTTLNDSFTPQVTSTGMSSITVTPVPISGFTGNLTLSCAVVPVTTTSTSVPPLCTLGSPTVMIIGTGSQTMVTIVLDATNPSTTPGAYSVMITGMDSATGLSRMSAPFTAYVRSKTAPITIVSGATTGNTTNADFILPANVGLMDLKCSFVGGPTLTAKVDPAGLSIGCTFNPTSVASSTTIQTATVAVTISTNGMNLVQIENDTGIFAASLIGIPVLALLGLLGSGKVSGRTFFRFLGIVFVAAAVMQTIGCGGHFTRTTTNTGLTPPGTYLILVQGTGSDGHTYDAVIQVNVTR